MTGTDNGAVGPAPRFPTYLIPSFQIPFRRLKQSSAWITTSSSPPKECSIPSLSTSPTDSILSSPLESPMVPSSTSRFSFSKDIRRTSPGPTLEAPKLARWQPDTLKCSTCSTDLAFSTQIVSKGFTGRYGRAYLVSPPDLLTKGARLAGNLINIRVGKSETRQLVTGTHIVADTTCATCHAKVGWKYVDAKEDTQKYKVGKFILETQRVIDTRNWEDVLVSETPYLEVDGELKDMSLTADCGEPVVFDSEDEDECEDLFAGAWDPELAARRRSRKVNRRVKHTTH